MDYTSYIPLDEFNGIVTNKPVSKMDSGDLLSVQNLIFNNGELQTRGGSKAITNLDSSVLNIVTQEHSFKLPLILTKSSIYRVDDIDIINPNLKITNLKLNAYVTKFGDDEVFSITNFNNSLVVISRSSAIYYFFDYETVSDNKLDLYELKPVVSNVFRDENGVNFNYRTTVIGAKISFKYFNTLFLANTTELVEKLDVNTGAVISSNTVTNKSRIRWCSSGFSPISDINTIPSDKQVVDNIVQYVWDISDARSTAGYLEIPDSVSEIRSCTVTSEGVILYLYDGSAYILTGGQGGMNITRLSNQLGLMTNKKSTATINDKVYGISNNGLFICDRTNATSLITKYISNWSDLLEASNNVSDVSVDTVNNNILFLCNVRSEKLLDATSFKTTILNLNSLDNKVTISTYRQKITAIGRQSILNFNSEEALETWNDVLNHYNANVWKDLPNVSWETLLKFGTRVFDFNTSCHIYGTESGEVGLFNLKLFPQDQTGDGLTHSIISGFLTNFISENVTINGCTTGLRFTNIEKNVKADISFYVNNLKTSKSISSTNKISIDNISKFGVYNIYNVGLKRVSSESTTIGLRVISNGVTFNISDFKVGVENAGIKTIK